MLELIVTILLLVLPLVFLWVLGLLGRPGNGLREGGLSAIDELLPGEARIDSTRVLLAEFKQMLRGSSGEQRELALAVLAQIRHDFFRLEYLLTRAARFLPELTFSGEVKRLGMSVEFRVRCELIRLQIILGWQVNRGLYAAAEKLDHLAQMASRTMGELARADMLPMLRADLRD
jgi:hypothetical protein